MFDKLVQRCSHISKKQPVLRPHSVFHAREHLRHFHSKRLEQRRLALRRHNFRNDLPQRRFARPVCFSDCFDVIEIHIFSPASGLVHLGVLRISVQNAKMDKPGSWTKYVNFDHIKAIAEAYRPCETTLREIIPKVMAAKGQPALLEPLAMEMSKV